MSRLLRYFSPGQAVFITAVTLGREPLLRENEELLLKAVRDVLGSADPSLRAWVIMPEHFHMVLDSPEGDTANTIRRIKLVFSSEHRSRCALYRKTIWQRRYWDHIIRDGTDLRRHIDYIHFNPVKHGLTDNPFDYPFSSARDYLAQGMYEPGWGITDRPGLNGKFGE